MNDAQRLKAMGIPVWELRRPELYPDSLSHEITLPNECQLLLVGESLPEEQDAWLFGKILASMKLDATQALYLPKSVTPLITQHALTWVWFCGVQPEPGFEGFQILTSPSLPVLQFDQAAKKALWQQIKRYEK